MQWENSAQNDEQKFWEVPAHLTSNMNHRMLCFRKKKICPPVQPLVSSHLMSYSEKFNHFKSY